eukprot:TRINITY_DN421_c0_g1_i2.p1 TRINITY_DN421_c0_g1~~TRINITY_DN421_c0_g1_i2.p1  ORF type:complete len:355 (+),score=49.60 TRINITY_DN421_c0_g1_i2:151-1215(+)
MSTIGGESNEEARTVTYKSSISSIGGKLVLNKPANFDEPALMSWVKQVIFTSYEPEFKKLGITDFNQIIIRKLLSKYNPNTDTIEKFPGSLYLEWNIQQEPPIKLARPNKFLKVVEEEDKDVPSAVPVCPSEKQNPTEKAAPALLNSKAFEASSTLPKEKKKAAPALLNSKEEEKAGPAFLNSKASEALTASLKKEKGAAPWLEFMRKNKNILTFPINKLKRLRPLREITGVPISICSEVGEEKMEQYLEIYRRDPKCKHLFDKKSLEQAGIAVLSEEKRLLVRDPKTEDDVAQFIRNFIRSAIPSEIEFPERNYIEVYGQRAICVGAKKVLQIQFPQPLKEIKESFQYMKEGV